MGVLPDKTIADLLGHTGPDITRRIYQHSQDKHREAVAAKTAEIFDFPASKKRSE
jgi:integrase